MTASSQTHYDVLGISRDSDAIEVRRAWKTLVQVWHPDRFSGDMVDAAQERAAKINDAYSTLRDTSRRAAYDCRLAADDLARESEAASAASAASAARAARRSTTGRAPRTFQSPAMAGHGSATVAADLPLEQQVLTALGDAWAAMRRHPRASLATAAACVLAFAGIAVFNVVTGPSLPTGSTVSHARRAVASTDDRSLEDLAAQARSAAEAANDQLAQQLQADAAAESAARSQPAPAAPAGPTGDAAGTPAEADVAPRPAAKSGGKVQEIIKPDGTHVLRIMPG